MYDGAHDNYFPDDVLTPEKIFRARMCLLYEPQDESALNELRGVFRTQLQELIDELDDA